jgi:Pyridoxamine 5'-phosphate oxidase
MGILTDEMKRAVTELQLCYVATVSPDGKPNLSPKGSITVLSDDELGFADLASPGTIERTFGTIPPSNSTSSILLPVVVSVSRARLRS